MKKWSGKVLIIVIGIGINVAGRGLAQKMVLPIWLDMIGTCIATYFGGIWSGILVGISNNVMAGFYDPTAWVYSITSVFAAFMLHRFIRRGFLSSIPRALISSFWLGVLCTVVSTPLNLVFFQGYSGNIWGDTLVDMLKWYEVPFIFASLAGEFIIEIVDKQVCVMVAYLLIRLLSMMRRFIKGKQDKSSEESSKSSKAGAMVSTVLAVVLLSQTVLPLQTQAEQNMMPRDSFTKEIYNNTNGLVSSEANTICGTEDGYIWLGSYAGLTRYDGTSFEFIRESGLANVVTMLNDKKGRLWIGTNDTGIARYEKGVYTYFTMQDGLPSNTIKCFAEDKEGNIYVGTSDRICCFHPDDTIEILDFDITFAKVMVAYQDWLVVLDNKGDIYAISEGKKVSVIQSKAKDYFYYCLCVTSRGLLIGTETGELFYGDIAKRGILLRKQVDMEATSIAAIYEDHEGRIWVATDSQFGYLDKFDQYRIISGDSFSSAIECFYEDYQGNIWIASSRHGVMKLSESLFVNLFDRLGMEGVYVNAVESYDGNIYCGTDSGLIILDDRDYHQIQVNWSEALNGYRVRSMLADSQGGLWICTYGGLFYHDAQGELTVYNQKDDGATSDRFRCITELADGTLAAGTANGINLLKENKVIGTLTEQEGLGNTQILTIVQAHDGSLWAGSDGSGIYVIEDGKLVRQYTDAEGLSSNVILRIVPYAKGYLVVTSNSLCHIGLDGTIRKLDKFPYLNNFDIIVHGQDAYVTCSAGLYKVNMDELCEDGGKRFRLYSISDGLVSNLTANSWNHLDQDGRLYLCSNSGLVLFYGEQNQTEAQMKYGIDSIQCDGKELTSEDQANYLVPFDSKDVSIYASVRNYSFTDIKVRFFVRELDNNPKIFEWNKVEPIRILKPDLPQYHICLQILDGAGKKVLQERIYSIQRELRAWENPTYQVYLLAVCMEILVFTIFSILGMILFVLRKNELERNQGVLEKKVGEQTRELREQEKQTKKLFLQTVTALSEAVDAKDRYTSGHSKRVAHYARLIAERMGKTKEEQEIIYRAGLLHDVGKIRIPNAIINKEGKLTDEEYNIIKVHPVTGYHILKGISGGTEIALATRHHHERYDGKGYPNGLEGDKIPEVARILAVADAYDAMASNRSYRKALPKEMVRNEISKGRGAQFDPDIAEIMLQIMDDDTEYTLKQEDMEQKKVLVVDDEPMNQKIIAHIMKEEPYYVIVAAASGEEALSILEQEKIDLILMDVDMPGMNGLETLRVIRQSYQIPVALMTDDKNLNEIRESENFNVEYDEYITKPFLPLLVKEIIHNMKEIERID